MNKLYTKGLMMILVVCLAMLFPMLATAQDGVPGDPDTVPIDGGLSLLVAAGVGYGAKRMKAKKAKQCQ